MYTLESLYRETNSRNRAATSRGKNELAVFAHFAFFCAQPLDEMILLRRLSMI